MKQNELDKILKLHKKWFNGEKGGNRADLSYADLKNADLSDANLIGANLSNANLSNLNLIGANLVGADLSNANLSNADLSNANLSGANLSNAKLSYANLIGADLSYANLSNADLTNANLYGADLINADLSDANLSGANLSNANLYGADLINANLRHADLSNANLSNADLSNADLKGVYADETTAFFHLQCPKEGNYIAYKRCQEDRIVKLLIPADAKRSSATSRKCRANKAKVLSITNIDGTENFEKAISCHNSNFIYKIGEIVEVEDFDEDRWHECSTGIHHFITRDEAVNYGG